MCFIYTLVLPMCYISEGITSMTEEWKLSVPLTISSGGNMTSCVGSRGINSDGSYSGWIEMVEFPCNRIDVT